MKGCGGRWGGREEGSDIPVKRIWKGFGLYFMFLNLIKKGD